MNETDPLDAYVKQQLALMEGRTPKTAEYLLRTAWSAGFLAGAMRMQEKKKRRRPAAQEVPQEVVRDAMRYRWLRDEADYGEWECFDSRWLMKYDVYGQGPAELDAAIDRALASPAAPEE